MGEAVHQLSSKGEVIVPSQEKMEVKKLKFSEGDVPCLITVKLRGDTLALNPFLKAEGGSIAFRSYGGTYSLIVKAPGEYSLVLTNEKNYKQEASYYLRVRRIFKIKGLIRVYGVEEFSPRTILVTDGIRFMVLKKISHIQKVLEAEKYSGISAWLAMRHEQVPRLLHANFERMYTLSEYVEGKPFSKTFERYRRVGADPLELARIIRELVKPLEYASNLGIIHRDVKPANIIVSPGGKVSLVDWELACWKGDCCFSVGENPYAPPEANKGSYHEKSDVYSLGVIIAEALGFLKRLNGGTILEVKLKDKSMLEEARELMRLSKEMRAENPEERPGLEDISRRLDEIMGSK